MSLQRVEALIFAEHSKLLIENPLLKEKIGALQELNHLYVKSDSLQKEEIIKQNSIITFNNEQINKLKKKQKNLLTGGIVGSALCFILGILL